MVKTHPIVKGTAATLLLMCGLIMVWAHNKQPSARAQSKPASVKAVRLRLTFGEGDAANVTTFEGGTIKIEKDGKKLSIAPYIRDQGSSKVELRVFQVVQREGRETMEAVDTLLVDKSVTNLTRGNLPLSVQVLDVERSLPVNPHVAPVAECCARTCSGTLVCGVCVCTDCGVCFTHGWCDCNPPAPPEE
jgi:hypothetical protein